MISRRLLSLSLGALAVVALTSALAWMTAIPFDRGDALTRARTSGVLRIGYAVEKPYAYISPTLEITGESPETARLVAARLGVAKIEWVQVPFGNLIPELLADRFDVIAAGMFATPERRRQVSFSSPVIKVKPGLLVRADSAQGIADPAAWLRNSSGRIAVLDGAVEGERLQHLGVAAERLWPMTSAHLGLDAVRKGVVDALALSWPATLAMAKSNSATDVKALELAMPAGNQDRYDWIAFAFHPEEQPLRRAWDRELLAIRGSPAHLEAIAPFGFAAGDVVSEPLPQWLQEP